MSNENSGTKYSVGQKVKFDCSNFMFAPTDATEGVIESVRVVGPMAIYTIVYDNTFEGTQSTIQVPESVIKSVIK